MSKYDSSGSLGYYICKDIAGMDQAFIEQSHSDYAFLNHLVCAV